MAGRTNPSRTGPTERVEDHGRSGSGPGPAGRCSWRSRLSGAGGCLALGGGGGQPVGLGAGLDDVGLEGEPVHDRLAEPLVGEGLVPLGERPVRGDRDRVPLLALGEDLEQQFGAVPVELDVAQFIQLCGYPHSCTYAETATMPNGVSAWLAATGEGNARSA